MIKKVRRKRIVIKQKELIIVHRDAPGAPHCPVCRRPLGAFEKPGVGATECRRIDDGKKTILEDMESNEAKN